MNRLRPVEAEDKARLREWRNLPEIRKYMYADHEISVDEHERWFNSIRQDPSRRYWIIVSDAEDVGLVNLYAMDAENRRCSWAFYLASPSVRGKGVGSYVEWTVLNHVFDDLAYNRLYCEVLVTNPAVVSMHEKFGFKREGLFREHVLKNGEPVDVVSLAILKNEWLELRPEMERKLREKRLIV